MIKQHPLILSPVKKDKLETLIEVTKHYLGRIYSEAQKLNLKKYHTALWAVGDIKPRVIP